MKRVIRTESAPQHLHVIPSLTNAHKVCAQPFRNSRIVKRRDWLHTIGGTIAAVWTAGCLYGGGGVGLEMERVERPAEFVAIQSSELTPTQTTLVQQTLDEGEYTTYGHGPFRDGDYLEFRGKYYQATVEQTGTKQIERQVLVAEVYNGTADAISRTDLPNGAGQPAVLAHRMAVVRDREDEREDLPEGYVFRTETAEGSIWLPEPEPEYAVIDFHDQTYQLRVVQRVLDEDEFKTTLERVASSTEEFEDIVDEEFVIDLDAEDLSDKQREIIETAIEDGYSESASISSEFDDLIDRLRAAPPRRDLIKYEGEYYSWNLWHSD